MRFKELFEMPTFINKELPVTDVKVHVASVDTLDREYDLLGSIPVRNKKIIAALKKDKSSAVIGPAVLRDDGKPSIEVIVTLTFHEAPNLGEANSNKTLQVDTVTSTDEARGFGYGYQLYKMILNHGYTLVSDNIQWKAGKELWLKIIRKSAADRHNVFILQDGKYMRDAEGKVIVFDGVNISPEDIWSEKRTSVKHYHTLLVAKNI